MLTKLVELALRTLLNTTAGRHRPEQPIAVLPVPPANPERLAHAWHIGKELRIGGNGVIADGEEIALRLADLKRSIHITGAIGCGKSTVVLNLIDYFLEEDMSFVLICLRGDLLDRVKLRLAVKHSAGEWRGRLLIADARDKWSVPINPLDGPSSPHSRAQDCKGNTQRRSLTWGVQIDDTVYPCFLALASVDPPYTLLEVDRLLTSKPFRHEVLKSVSDPFVLNWFARYEALSDDQKQAWTQPVLNKITSLLAMPPVRRMVCQRATVPLRRIFDRAGSVTLIGLDYTELREASFLLGDLWISAIIQAIFSRADVPEGEATRPPVAIIVDEFEHFASPDFARFGQESRRFGGFLCVSHQSIGQLPDKLADLLLNIVHLRIAYQTGASDAARIAREVGLEHTKQVATQLLNLPVGQAFLIEKGHTTRRIQVHNSPDPVVDRAVLAELDKVSAEVYARSAEEVDAELVQRSHREPSVPELQKPAPKSSSRRPPKAPDPAATYEVRPRKVRATRQEEDTP